MTDKIMLADMQKEDLKSCDKDNLTDISGIEIDKGKPFEDRLYDYLGKVQNPYLFRVGDIAVKISYSNSGKSFSQAVASGLTAS